MHLTSLCVEGTKAPPEGAAPLRRLATAVPRLEALDWFRGDDQSIPAAAEGHPCLHKLGVLGQQEAWLRAALRLPALLTLDLWVHPRLFEGPGDVEGEGGAALQVPCVFGWLAHCKRLSHLVLRVRACMSTHDLLAAVGAAAGGRLLSLTLDDVELPQTRDAAARAMQALVACYPRLEVLTLWPEIVYQDSAAQALSRELLLAVPAVAPLCPALGKVRVKQNAVQLQRHPGGRFAAAKFVGSCLE